MTAYCLDACALITVFKQEPGFEIIRDLLRRAAAGEAAVSMSAVNLSEVIYNFRPETSDEQMAALWQHIRAMPLTIVREITDPMINEAARLKARNKMSHADALGLATAKELGAAANRRFDVTSEHDELEAVAQQEPISFLWLPAKPKK
jgi:predicted nucleic acid-binding protein